MYKNEITLTHAVAGQYIDMKLWSNKRWDLSSNMSCGISYETWTRLIYHTCIKVRSNFRKERNQKFWPRTDWSVDCRSTEIPGQSTDGSTETGRELGFPMSVDPTVDRSRPWGPGFLAVDWLMDRSTAYTKLCTFVHIGRPLSDIGRPEFWNMLLFV